MKSRGGWLAETERVTRPPIRGMGTQFRQTSGSGDRTDWFTDAGARPEQSLSVEAHDLSPTFGPLAEPERPRCDPNAALRPSQLVGGPPSALGATHSSRKSSTAMSGSCVTCEKNAATRRPVASSTISVKRGRIQSWNIVRVSRTCGNAPFGDHPLLDRREAVFQPCHHDVLMDEGSRSVGAPSVVLAVHRSDAVRDCRRLALEISRARRIIHSALLPVRLRPGATHTARSGGRRELRENQCTPVASQGWG